MKCWDGTRRVAQFQRISRGRELNVPMRKTMKPEIIRVEPLATYLEKYKAPASMVTKHGDTIYVSGSPPFDPKTGEIFKGAIERQAEIVLDQLKLCVETAGSSLGKHSQGECIRHLGGHVSCGE